MSVFTSSSDGTTHRSLNYEALHLNMRAPETYSPARKDILKPKMRRAPVRVEANHRTSTQIQGELAYFDQLLGTLEHSPLDVDEKSIG